TVIPQMIYDKTGIQSIVVANNMESTKSSYWAVREIADRFPKAKIFVELYTASTEYNEDMHHNYYTSAIRRMPEWSIYKYLGLRDLIKNGNDINWQYYFRFFSSRSQCFDLKYEDFPVANKNRLLECKGYDPRFNIMEGGVFEKNDLTENEKASINISDENLEYIQKIVDLSNDQKFDVFFFVSPYLTNSSEDYKYQLIDDFVEKNNKKILNFNSLKEELQLLDGMYYKDEGHTNYYGASVVTDYLSWYLADMFPKDFIENREKDEIWERYEGCYNKWLSFQQLSTITDVKEYFDILESYKSDVLVLMAIQGDKEAFFNRIKAEGMTDLYASIGITGSDSESFFVLGTGQERAEFEKIEFNYGNRAMVLKSEGGEANILIDCIDMSKKVNGINICVFNAEDMTLIDNAAVWNGTPNKIVR
ncbi:hypothetical protein HDR58_05965, partial [bacterium]|nr:hypothetical protein [bacterium]